MTRATHGGKGDRIPGANDAAYQENYPAIDWGARKRAHTKSLSERIIDKHHEALLALSDEPSEVTP